MCLTASFIIMIHIRDYKIPYKQMDNKRKVTPQKAAGTKIEPASSGNGLMANKRNAITELFENKNFSDENCTFF